MLRTLLGEAGFRRGMDLYFERHDGQAVTCDDFRAALADANGRDLEQFGRWYSQVGTPVLRARGEHDAAAGTFTLTLEQAPPAAANGREAELLHIRWRWGCWGPTVRRCRCSLAGEAEGVGTTRVLELREQTQTLHLRGDPGGAGGVAAARLLGARGARLPAQRRRAGRS
jgi:aminopeptidase N